MFKNLKQKVLISAFVELANNRLKNSKQSVTCNPVALKTGYDIYITVNVTVINKCLPMTTLSVKLYQ